MAKTITGKRVTFEVEFYWRGKRKSPSVSISYASDNYDGLPPEVGNSPECEAFYRAAEKLCKKMVEAGELDLSVDEKEKGVLTGN